MNASYLVKLRKCVYKECQKHSFVRGLVLALTYTVLILLMKKWSIILLLPLVTH